MTSGGVRSSLASHSGSTLALSPQPLGLHLLLVLLLLLLMLPHAERLVLNVLPLHLL